MSPYYPTEEETKYNCRGCGQWFYPGAMDCLVLHPPGTCCHKYDTPASPRVEGDAVSERYILVDGRPEPCEDLLEWGRWLEEHRSERILQQDRLGEIKVSTVFLGLNHSFGAGPPLLWETMIFGGPHDQYQERYSTRDEAVEGHQKAVVLASSEPKATAP